jgi:DNA-binding transcriptional LysR family regulator
LQYRRIVDDTMRTLDLEPLPLIETDSVAALMSHVQTGNWVSIVPSSIVDSMDTAALRAIPIISPEVTHTLGLVVSNRYPIHATVEALISQARQICPPELMAAE